MICYNTVAETDALYASPTGLTNKLIYSVVGKICRDIGKCPDNVKEGICKLAVENFETQFKEKGRNLFGKAESFFEKVRGVRRYTRIDIILNYEGHEIVKVKFTPMIF